MDHGSCPKTDRVPSGEVWEAKSNWMMRVKRTVMVITRRSSRLVSGLATRLEMAD